MIADRILHWGFTNVMPWVLLGMLVLAVGMVLCLVMAAIQAFTRRNDEPTPIELDPGEWDCVEWHEEEQYVPPLLIGGAIYPQPPRKVTVADVYVRRGFNGGANAAKKGIE